MSNQQEYIIENANCNAPQPVHLYPSLPALVLKAVELYNTDVLAPSITTSWLKDKKVWYVSVIRWRGVRNELTRQVLFGVSDQDLEKAYAEALHRLS